MVAGTVLFVLGFSAVFALLGLAAGGISELTLSFSTGTAARGTFLALVYGLGLGIPFLVVAALFERTLDVMAFFKCHARLVARIGGFLLIALGLFEATGTWTAVVNWMHTHWFQTYTPQL
jgi:cytochrome c-type biogenesis protein